MLSGVCCSGLAVPRDDRPPIDRVRPGADYTSREVTRPGTGRHPRLTVDELADTHDDEDSGRVRDMMAAARLQLELRDAELVDLPTMEWARRIEGSLAQLREAVDRAHLDDRDHRALVARIAACEAEARDHRAYQLKLSGVAEGNGRLGAMDRTIAAIREDLGTSKERAAERATVAAVRWTTAKVLALLGAAGLATGGGIWTSIQARDALRAAEAHARGQREEHDVGQDRRLDEFARRLDCLEGKCP